MFAHALSQASDDGLPESFDLTGGDSQEEPPDEESEEEEPPDYDESQMSLISLY